MPGIMMISTDTLQTVLSINERDRSPEPIVASEPKFE